MSGGFAIGREICNGNSIGVNAGTTYGTAVAGGAANTPGSWVQLVASSPSDTCWMHIEVQLNSSFNNWALNIGVGAAGSEQIVFKDLFMGNYIGIASDVDYVLFFELPCSIPAGTRIAAQLQSSGASDTAYITAQLFDSAFVHGEGYAGSDPIGFTSASTAGTSIPVAGTTNTKGSYAQLTASTARDYAGFSLGVGILANDTYVYGLDIAIGAAGSEKIILPDLVIGAGGFSALAPSTIFWLPIPEGTRIAARIETNGGTSSAYNLPLTLNGFYL